jgi:hypothetical protein
MRKFKTKNNILFFWDEIFRSSIIVFQDDYLAYDYNRTLHTMLSEETKNSSNTRVSRNVYYKRKRSLEVRFKMVGNKISVAVRILKKKDKNTMRDQVVVLIII